MSEIPLVSEFFTNFHTMSTDLHIDQYVTSPLKRRLPTVFQPNNGKKENTLIIS